MGSVQVWDHYEKHVQEYGSDFVSYFFGQGPREQRDCEELVIQWYQIPGAGGLYGVALFGAQSHLLVTAIPMRRTELLRLLEKSGCPKGHVGHDSMGGSGFAY
uniref:Uncharacterized protein n=1 Tax=viral metagenome TaxID=1070528 RepID=A0A6M3J290_9ZZZZ